MATSKSAVIANQVFIGCPWKTVRPKYFGIIDELNKKYPISFVLIGKESSQSAEDLLSIIKEKMLSSSYAIFDVTGGNANVSLEFGFSEASGIKAALYYCNHGKQQGSSRGAIISDLAGKRRKEYKQENSLKSLLDQFCRSHVYFIRFDKALKKAFARQPSGTKKRLRALAMKVIHELDDVPKVRRVDLIGNMQALTGNYGKKEINIVLEKLRKAGMIYISQGRYSDVTIS